MSPDDMEIDPSIAAAMGFAGFGMQNKKRKHGDDDAFTTATDAPASGSNATAPSGSRSVGVQNGQPRTEMKGKQIATAHTTSSQPAEAETATGSDDKPTLEALRHGIKNAQGDVVYFLPSFIEDPWERLRGR